MKTRTFSKLVEEIMKARFARYAPKPNEAIAIVVVTLCHHQYAFKWKIVVMNQSLDGLLSTASIDIIAAR